MPGHELVDAALRPAIDEARQHVGEVALRIGAVELAGLHQRRHGRPAGAPVISGGEQRILSAQDHWADGAFHHIAVDLDALVVEEPLETLAMVQRVADRLRCRRAPGRRASCASSQANRSSVSALLFAWRAARLMSGGLPRTSASMA